MNNRSKTDAVRAKVPGNLRHAIFAKPENDEDDGTDYIETERGTSQIGVPNGPGVVVPMETNEGGLVGKRYSVYGKIIMGAAITRKGYVPLNIHSSIARAAPSIFDDEDAPPKYEVPIVPVQPGMRKEAAMKNPTQLAQSSPQSAMPAPAPVRQRIVMSGSFGRYSGNYLAWEENADQVVLISSIEDANFVPPVSEDPVTVKIGDRSFMVKFEGTAFSLEIYNAEITVFKKHEQYRDLDGAKA